MSKKLNLEVMPESLSESGKIKIRPGRGQDEFTRFKRKSEGRCPTHGTYLIIAGIYLDTKGKPLGPVATCPRGDCTFIENVKLGTRLYLALKERGETD